MTPRMDAKFTIRVDPRQNLVRVTLSGFFTPEDIDSLVVARNATYLELTSLPNMHITLCDISDIKIQAQDIVSAFHNVLSDDDYRARKLAVVVASTLARKQLERAAAGRFFRVFTSVEEALLWLHDDDVVAPGVAMASIAASMSPMAQRLSV